MTDAIIDAANLLKNATYVTALTGAGISTPSGIPDFRSNNAGMWEKFDPMLVASIVGFKHAPENFYEWIAPLAKTLVEAQPNPAHLALAKLETLGKLESVITQNVDMLHSRAGSQTVYEVHGHLREATCIKCFHIYDAEPLIHQIIAGAKTLTCEVCGGVLKPNVILFGEQLPLPILEAAERDARRCDVMVIAGSSLEVYPIADLPRQAYASGANMIIINEEPTPYDDKASVVIHDDVAQTLPKIVETLEKLL